MRMLLLSLFLLADVSLCFNIRFHRFTNIRNVELPRCSAISCRTKLHLSAKPPGPGRPAAAPPSGPPKSKQVELVNELFDKVFPLLYSFSPLRSSTLESFKNLRVLWTRALLNSVGELDDDVAYELLPKVTRALVGEGPLAVLLWIAVKDKVSWIKDRTQFIDDSLLGFLEEHKNEKCNVLLLGAGFDTRSVRMSKKFGDALFYEVDLGEVVETKQALLEDLGKFPNIELTKFDLNREPENLVGSLPGFDKSLPTCVIVEAVMFYVDAPKVQQTFKALFAEGFEKYVVVDNLAKVGVIPGGPPGVQAGKCEEWITREKREMGKHKAIWGG